MKYEIGKFLHSLLTFRSLLQKTTETAHLQGMMVQDVLSVLFYNKLQYAKKQKV